MISLFPLAPRYRLDDECVWLKGIDPSRHYWIYVNGDREEVAIVPGLIVENLDRFKQTVREFRALEPGQSIEIHRAAQSFNIHCIAANCYGLETDVSGALVWHLFDRETIESLLMTAHPDWQCAPKDVELGRELLLQSWQQAFAA
ncbi:MAG: hypothetical protein SWY16_20165 [Cyanobacteriota bacterium]|nr:hypothetical protein [Cyanobacteriota bacterium]